MQLIWTTSHMSARNMMKIFVMNMKIKENEIKHAIKKLMSEKQQERQKKNSLM